MANDNSLLGLATIRQNRGISLEQIAEQTKISKRSLVAIEQGDFKKLPGGIYSTSYIRQYAKAIDYDESAILAVYHRVMGIGDSSSQPTAEGAGKGTFGGFRPASIPGL
jgi:cytoskeletal protein RodZ